MLNGAEIPPRKRISGRTFDLIAKEKINNATERCKKIKFN